MGVLVIYNSITNQPEFSGLKQFISHGFLWVDSWAVFAWDLCGCSQLAAKSGSTKGSTELDV